MTQRPRRAVVEVIALYNFKEIGKALTLIDHYKL